MWRNARIRIPTTRQMIKNKIRLLNYHHKQNHPTIKSRVAVVMKVFYSSIFRLILIPTKTNTGI